jgi:hypothetical protein
MLESSQAGRRDVRHDDAVRRSLMVLAGTFVVSGALAIPAAASSLPTVRTVAGSGGSGSLRSPTGIAVDAAGDLFVADTNHCRVMLVPSRTGSRWRRITRTAWWAVGAVGKPAWASPLASRLTMRGMSTLPKPPTRGS